MATPYIGSKICLISKAEIRYEGILYTIDSKESTVALAKVRAFGTEDREAETQFPALDEIFEYIIFKAADIKEIRVCQPPVSSVASDPAIVSHSMAPGPPGNSVAPPTPEGLAGPSFGDFSGTPYAGPVPPFMNETPFGYVNPVMDPSSMMNLSGIIPPYKEQPIGFSGGKAESLLEGSRTSSPDVSKIRNEGRRDVENEEFKRRHRDPPNYHQGKQRQNYPPRDNNYRRNNDGYGGHDGERSHRGPHPRGPPRRPNQQNKEPPKFDGEFDFDKANLEFQELESKMAKAKISENEEADDEWAEGDEEEEGKATSEKENNEGNSDEYYNKSKSFFDKISCEALEREKGGNSGRNEKRNERTINKETFGISSAPYRGHRRMNWQGGYDSNRSDGRAHYGGGGRGGGYGGNRGGGSYHYNYRNYGGDYRNSHGNNHQGHGGYGSNHGYDRRNGPPRNQNWQRTGRYERQPQQQQQQQ